MKLNIDYYSEDQYAVSIKEDTAYPCLYSPKTTEDKAQYAVSRETQYAVFKIWNEYNILEDIKRGPYSKKSPVRRIQLLGYEYIRLEEEKARRRGKVYNWETATYGKNWDNEDVHDLRSVETEFPAIVFIDTLTSEATLSCEPTVSSLNNDEIDFRISFDESNDEDYTKNQRCKVLYKVEDIATCLVEYVKLWDDWEVDRYGNANLDRELWIRPIRRIHQEDMAYRACTHQITTADKAQYAYLE
ncbi:hypothetical protein Tco_1176869 [Tanacetum coccineum]